MGVHWRNCIFCYLLSSMTCIGLIQTHSIFPPLEEFGVQLDCHCLSCSNYPSHRQICFSLQLSNYSSFEGVLYCKPHFDQLFKMTGSLDKSFEGIQCHSTNINRSFCLLAKMNQFVNFSGTPKTVNRSSDQVPTNFLSLSICRYNRTGLLNSCLIFVQVTNSRVSRFFSGTQEKCVACKKTVYPIEKVHLYEFDGKHASL